mmetsp:Transcript_25002/g.74594  ORF Transcript_25002/g.74594 Transcript_25002/m.74594 type:complete len:218 (+) Transcript_25002:620-1273(+)
MYEYADCVVGVVEHQGVAQSAHGAGERPGGDAEERAEEHLAHALLVDCCHDARARARKADVCMEGVDAQEYVAQEVPDPAEVQPIERLRERPCRDHVPPPEGEEHQRLEDVEEPEVLGDDAEAPRHEEQVQDAEEEAPGAHAPLLQSNCTLLEDPYTPKDGRVIEGIALLLPLLRFAPVNQDKAFRALCHRRPCRRSVAAPRCAAPRRDLGRAEGTM